MGTMTTPRFDAAPPGVVQTTTCASGNAATTSAIGAATIITRVPGTQPQCRRKPYGSRTRHRVSMMTAIAQLAAGCVRGVSRTMPSRTVNASGCPDAHPIAIASRRRATRP